MRGSLKGCVHCGADKLGRIINERLLVNSLAGDLIVHALVDLISGSAWSDHAGWSTIDLQSCWSVLIPGDQGPDQNALEIKFTGIEKRELGAKLAEKVGFSRGRENMTSLPAFSRQWLCAKASSVPLWLAIWPHSDGIQVSIQANSASGTVRMVILHVSNRELQFVAKKDLNSFLHGFCWVDLYNSGPADFGVNWTLIVNQRVIQRLAMF